MMTTLEPVEEIVNTVIFEQGYDVILLNNYFYFVERLKDDKYILFDDIITHNGNKCTIRDALGEDIWCFFVVLYGEYGVSLRTGWIVDKGGFVNFIENIITERLYKTNLDNKQPLKELIENLLKQYKNKYGIEFSVASGLDLYDDEDYYINNYDFRKENGMI